MTAARCCAPWGSTLARTRARRPRGSGGANGRSNDGILPVLARVVREVEADVRRGRIGQATRAKFQAVAMLTREERTKVKSDTAATESFRTEQLRDETQRLFLRITVR